MEISGGLVLRLRSRYPSWPASDLSHGEAGLQQNATDSTRAGLRESGGRSKFDMDLGWRKLVLESHPPLKFLHG
jgi:hypothetical protein